MAVSLLAAVFFGVSLWPVAHEIFLISERLGLSLLENEQISAAQGDARQMYGLPLWLILLTLAVVPAVFEELCFRGFLFGSLRTVMPGWWAVASPPFCSAYFTK